MSTGMYVNGVIPSIGKRLAIYTFGSAFHKFEADKSNGEYLVYLNKQVNEQVVARFKKHWPGFRILVIQVSEG